jgi:hypothetical protein
MYIDNAYAKMSFNRNVWPFVILSTLIPMVIVNVLSKVIPTFIANVLTNVNPNVILAVTKGPIEYQTVIALFLINTCAVGDTIITYGLSEKFRYTKRVIRSGKLKKYRQDNDQKKKVTNIDLQNTTQNQIY